MHTGFGLPAGSGQPEDSGKPMIVIKTGFLSRRLPIMLITDSIGPVIHNQIYGDIAGGQILQR
ncbi:hypothetical protein CAP48_16075 [Advenella sp. S44]|nr:hypothetical protein CAP48_16075 [Advenella sp. S44]